MTTPAVELSAAAEKIRDLTKVFTVTVGPEFADALAALLDGMAASWAHTESRLHVEYPPTPVAALARAILGQSKVEGRHG